MLIAPDSWKYIGSLRLLTLPWLEPAVYQNKTILAEFSQYGRDLIVCVSVGKHAPSWNKYLLPYDYLHNIFCAQVKKKK